MDERDEREEIREGRSDVEERADVEDRSEVDEHFDAGERQEKDLDGEWAERLGMDYDPARVRQTPPPPPYVAPEAYASAMEPPHHEPMPPTYLIWAIVCTLCCCMPAGVVAIVYASQVSSKYFARDYAGARKASHTAEIWIIASIVVGVIFNALYLPLSLIQGVLTGV